MVYTYLLVLQSQPLFRHNMHASDIFYSQEHLLYKGCLPSHFLFQELNGVHKTNNTDKLLALNKR